MAENGKYFDFSSDEIIRIAELAVRGESPARHRDRWCARLARRDEGKYRQYVTEEQRSQAGCSAGRMQLDFHHGLLVPKRRLPVEPVSISNSTAPNAHTSARLSMAFPFACSGAM